MTVSDLQEWADFAERLGWEFVGLCEGGALIRLRSGRHVTLSDEIKQDIQNALDQRAAGDT